MSSSFVAVCTVLLPAPSKNLQFTSKTAYYLNVTYTDFKERDAVLHTSWRVASHGINRQVETGLTELLFANAIQPQCVVQHIRKISLS